MRTAVARNNLDRAQRTLSYGAALAAAALSCRSEESSCALWRDARCWQRDSRSVRLRNGQLYTRVTTASLSSAALKAA